MGLKSDKLFERSGSASDNLRIWQIKFLEDIVTAVAPSGGLATESTLISVLNAIIASDQDIEILLVRDTGNGDKVVQQITNYETGTPVVTYKDVDGNPYVPVGPLEYLDPSAVLNLILTEIQNINTPQSVSTTINRRTNAADSPVASGQRKVSVFNAGNANGSFGGAIIKPGESWSFSADGVRDTLPSFAYDGTGTELVITTVG
jgi:hypothetical protein